MAAHQNVPEVSSGSKSPTVLVPQHGTLTSFGYGTRLYVERGHLTIEDGIGADRRKARMPRVGHGLRRLVVIGSDGFVSLAALRWLSDQSASFVMLERDGSVLTTTGPVQPSDARLRRAQALAQHSGLALKIAIELIYRKLLGQEKLVRGKLGDSLTADTIARYAASVKTARSIEIVRQLEARGALAYWLAWREIPIQFPRNDLDRVPNHWRRFGTRKSPLTGSPRLAVNPPNAMLNYLYALLESESRLALAALGLDPGLGILHFDSQSRDSFACDLMEAGRPHVDAYVLDRITQQTLNRKWFFEQRDGNCRLTNSFAEQLSMTASTWASVVAPVAEWISRSFWQTIAKPTRRTIPATRLTQNARRNAKGGADHFVRTPPTPPRLCARCGDSVRSGKSNCASCGKEVSRENLIRVAKLGRVVTHGPRAQALRGATQRKQAAALKAWKPSDQPNWLTEQAFRDKVLARLTYISIPKISAALDISEPYAAGIRGGKRIPHKRHWLGLAKLVAVTALSQ
jgi:CRISPR-associated endonuclease Cas1